MAGRGSRFHAKLDRRRWRAVRRAVLERDNYRCQSCGRVATYQPEVDHITPLHRGGAPYDPANLQTLCGGAGGCHAAKTGRENERPVPGRDAWRALVAELCSLDA